MDKPSDDEQRSLCTRIDTEMGEAYATMEQIEALLSGPAAQNQDKRVNNLCVKTIGLVDGVLNVSLPDVMRDHPDIQALMRRLAALRRLAVGVHKNTQ